MSETYSLLYSPELNVDKSDINFVCSDNRIHFRFKDYLKPEVIEGFEKKLTYLMTYLFNFGYLKNSDITNIPSRTVINNFIKCDDVKKVINVINSNITSLKFKGFRGRVNYNKTNSSNYPFGNINKNYFPVSDLNNQSCLHSFLSSFRIDLVNYLFNDRYIIILHNVKDSNINDKFKKKELKTQDNPNNCFVKLW